MVVIVNYFVLGTGEAAECSRHLSPGCHEMSSSLLPRQELGYEL